MKILTTQSHLMLAKLLDTASLLKATLKYKKITVSAQRTTMKESKIDLLFINKNHQQIQVWITIGKRKGIVKMRKGNLMRDILNTAGKCQ